MKTGLHGRFFYVRYRWGLNAKTSGRKKTGPQAGF
jgi:hypothetical protein